MTKKDRKSEGEGERGRREHARPGAAQEPRSDTKVLAQGSDAGEEGGLTLSQRGGEEAVQSEPEGELANSTWLPGSQHHLKRMKQ